MLQPKQILGEFEIIRLLGKGGMGEVYEAQQSRPQRRVALKVLAPWLAADKEALKRFWREADVPAQLDHPGIVRIITMNETDGIAYYTMQLVRGISLAQLLRRAKETAPETIEHSVADTSHSESDTPANVGAPPTEDVPLSDAPSTALTAYRADRFGMLARIGIQVAKALDAAHRQGYLHRDIKPSNIMIDQHDQVYLVDFGLTRALDSGAGTRVGAVVGTPWFMSPEQARGLALDARSDIYSLGVTLYQLATAGQGPYTARREDTDAVLREIASGEMQPLANLAPEIPRPLEQIINRAVSASPELRYQTAGDLAKELDAFLQSASLEPTYRVAQPPRSPRIPEWVLVAAGLLMTMGLVALILPWEREPRQVVQQPAKGKPIPDTGRPKGEIPKQPANAGPFQRDRPLTAKMNLLREDGLPVLSRFLVGQGVLQSHSTELFLKALGPNPVLLALDDPGQRDYDLALELRSPLQLAPDINDVGVFFGWRDQLADPRAKMRFFALKLDTRPILNDIQGRLNVGTWQFGEGAEAIWEADLRALPKGRGMIPLIPPKPTGWRRLELTVRDQKFTVSVDNQPAQIFTLDEVTRNDKNMKAWDLDCRGMFGVWVRKGVGHFRNVTMIPRS